MLHTLKRFADSMKRSFWFEDYFGFREETFRVTKSKFLIQNEYLLWHCPKQNIQRRVNIGLFSTPTVFELRAKSLSLQESLQINLRTIHFNHYCDVEGVKTMISDPNNASSVFQAASQFNCLEMVNPSVLPRRGITHYVDDPTQGPQCALACPGALLYRNYLVEHHRVTGQDSCQIDCMEDVGDLFNNSAEKLWEMQNGYLLPSSKASLRHICERLKHDTEFARLVEDSVRVGVHWSTTVKSETHKVTQIFASALPVAYSNIKCDPQLWEPFAGLILRAAYDATLLAASCIAKENNTRVKVYLTKLGGGVFGNRSEWICDAISYALHRNMHAPLDVYLVHYGHNIDPYYSNIQIPSTMRGINENSLNDEDLRTAERR